MPWPLFSLILHGHCCKPEKPAGRYPFISQANMLHCWEFTVHQSLSVRPRLSRELWPLKGKALWESSNELSVGGNEEWLCMYFLKAHEALVGTDPDRRAPGRKRKQQQFLEHEILSVPFPFSWLVPHSPKHVYYFHLAHNLLRIIFLIC